MELGFRSIASDGVRNTRVLEASSQLLFVQSSVDANVQSPFATQAALFGKERFVDGPKSVLSFGAARDGSAYFSFWVVWER